AIVLTAVTCAAAFLLSFIRFGEHGLTERVVRIQSAMTNNFEHIFDDCLKNHSEQFNLVSAETTRMGTELELTFALRVAKNFSPAKLLEDLSRLNQNLKVQIVGSSHVYDL
ncbi:MAG: hypothetical protein KDD53_11690, partial [Bdellovibrionales bacterium]|nr:hypothetical protein [Bdellovibrionales bacterium]